jgi:hypothetical protein
MSIATRIDLRPAAWVAALFGMAVSGCTSLTTVNGTDNSAFLPSMRIAWDVSSSPASSPSASSSQPHSGRAMELFVAHGSGDSTQSLSAGQQPIQFGGVTFNAPLSIREQFDFSLATLSYRWRKLFNNVGFEVLGGVGYGALDATLDAGAQHGTENPSKFVGAGAVGVIWNLTPSTSLQGRVTIGASSRFSFGRSEAVVVQALGKNAAVRAGWAWWNWNDDANTSSDIHFKLSGPTLGLDLEF